jgi:hypothetical protein
MRRGAALAPLRYPKVLGPALQTGGALLFRRSGEWDRFHKKPIIQLRPFGRSGRLPSGGLVALRLRNANLPKLNGSYLISAVKAGVALRPPISLKLFQNSSSRLLLVFPMRLGLIDAAIFGHSRRIKAAIASSRVAA